MVFNPFVGFAPRNGGRGSCLTHFSAELYCIFERLKSPEANGLTGHPHKNRPKHALLCQPPFVVVVLRLIVTYTLVRRRNTWGTPWWSCSHLSETFCPSARFVFFLRTDSACAPSSFRLFVPSRGLVARISPRAKLPHTRHMQCAKGGKGGRSLRRGLGGVRLQEEGEGVRRDVAAHVAHAGGQLVPHAVTAAVVLAAVEPRGVARLLVHPEGGAPQGGVGSRVAWDMQEKKQVP